MPALFPFYLCSNLSSYRRFGEHLCVSFIRHQLSHSINQKQKKHKVLSTRLSTTAQLSSSGGTFSRRYSTIASGPFSTCRPYGMACVLMSGFICFAIDWISAACSAVHMDAQNCFVCGDRVSTYTVYSIECLFLLTSKSGCSSFTLGATSSISV